MQTIGERLEEARKKKGISIREAAEATKIRGDYLQRFESNHFDIGLTEIYTRGFLRTYSNYLKLPADRILNDYAALGRGDAKPRQPAREVYGRMDISVAHADSPDRNAAPTDTPPPEPSPANRGPQRPRTGSSLPTGPDPAVIFKYVKIGGIVVIAVLLLWIIKALFFTGTATPNARPGQSVPRGPTFGLVATSPVQVTVRKKNPDGTEGDYLYSGVVNPGETKIVSRPGAVFIEANLPDNLLLEINGQRFPLKVPRGELPAP